MTRQTLFLSDLHLPADASPLREAFLHFLGGPGRSASAIYILGDLFESWIGDDVGLQIYAREVAALAATVAGGVPVYFIHGNRDFLVGRDFSGITGAKVLPDPYQSEIGQQATLLSHGDLFCTDDVGYQRWRRFSRIRFMQWLFLRLPKSRRLKIALALRGESDQAKQNKNDRIMDVNAEAIKKALNAWRPQRLIHGHTHRPATHDEASDHGSVERIVLPDWRHEDYRYLSMSETGEYALKKLEPNLK